jgi:hypothetical protein
VVAGAPPHRVSFQLRLNIQRTSQAKLFQPLSTSIQIAPTSVHKSAISTPIISRLSIATWRRSPAECLWLGNRHSPRTRVHTWPFFHGDGSSLPFLGYPPYLPLTDHRLQRRTVVILSLMFVTLASDSIGILIATLFRCVMER